MMNYKKTIAIVGILGLSIFLFGCESDQTDRKSNDLSAAETGTESAPTNNELYSFTAVDTDGVTRASSEWIGKQPVVLNFWGTWCPPCRKEIPELVKLYKEYAPKGIEIVSIAIKDSPEKVSEYAARAGMDWVMLVDDYSVATKYRVSGVPSTLFFDRNGSLVKVLDYNGMKVDRFVGPRPYEVFKEAFESIL